MAIIYSRIQLSSSFSCLHPEAVMCPRLFYLIYIYISNTWINSSVFAQNYKRGKLCIELVILHVWCIFRIFNNINMAIITGDMAIIGRLVWFFIIFWVLINNFNVCAQNTKRGKPCIELHMQDASYYMFAADTDHDLDSWITALKKVIASNEAMNEKLKGISFFTKIWNILDFNKAFTLDRLKYNNCDALC